MTDWAATASAAFAGAGLVATAWQLRQRSADSVKERRLEIEGVCATWRPKSAPRPNDVRPDGLAEWTYEFFVHNPGRFPISSVVLLVRFPVPVQRIRGSHRDQPTRELEMVHPVLSGGGQRRWDRTLQMAYADAEGQLQSTVASVSFIDAEGRTQTTEWPHRQAPPVRDSSASSLQSRRRSR